MSLQHEAATSKKHVQSRAAYVIDAPFEEVMNRLRKLDCSMPTSAAQRGERIALRAWRDLGG